MVRFRYFRRLIVPNRFTLPTNLSFEVIKACEIVLLPRNSTHICQPLDVDVFRPIEVLWRNFLTEWKQHNKGVIPKQKFSSLLKQLMDRASGRMAENIISGFSATGIHPFNPDKVLDKIKPKVLFEDQANPEIVQSFLNVMESLTQVNEKVS